jgi:predicted ATPase
VAQLGATLGREFSHDLIQAVSSLSEMDLHSALEKLVEAEILYQRGIGEQARYFFKHVLIQDTAYQSLLKSTRQQYYQQIAQVLEERFSDTKETQPELVAHHYTEADLRAQALPYWQQAGEHAIQRSAYVEAVAHLTQGLELLKTLQDTPARVQQELMLQIALGPALVVTKGYAAPEVEKAYTRARELCLQVGEAPQLFPAMWGLWVSAFIRTELETARKLGEQLLTLAQEMQKPGLLVEAHYALGGPLFLLGELTSAQAHLERAIALYDTLPPRSLASPYGAQDPGMASLSVVAWALWLLGYPDQTLKRVYEALTLAQRLSHSPSLTFAFSYVAAVHQIRREGQAAQEWAEAAITLSTEQGFPLWMGWATILRGWALAEQGGAEEGIAQMRQGWLAFQATGARWGRQHFVALLAEAYGKAGQVEEGLSALAEALAVGKKTEERFYEAELYRLKGELLVAQESREQGAGSKEQNLAGPEPQSQILDPHGEAEACFLKAIDTARQQQAKSWELRAATSLARLWQQQGKTVEAHKLLSDVYNWFTEGFDTKDLQEAKALLEAVAEEQ